MEQYLDIVRTILNEGVLKENRTGVSAYTIPGMMFEHEMENGFPLLTTKRIPYRLVTSELEFFIKGITDKKWLQDRNNHIWDEWCNPMKVPYGHDEETKRRMKEERDLGPVYGWQWKHFGADYRGYDVDYSGEGTDQLAGLIDTLKTNPGDRRMIVSAWNVDDLDKMALPPCHYQFQVTVVDEKLNLMWTQRSIDVMLGLPFNIASYATLLHLLAKDTGFKEGKLTGFLGDTHIYENHVEGAREQLSRQPYELPEVVTANFDSVLNWGYKDSQLTGYTHQPTIKFEIAV
ncbi:MAG: thymidylate synthase [Candidatus Altiarchaeota archaeon]|nr:thymidylate synthase [Candidatus Altiarchaeota archaeon]